MPGLIGVEHGRQVGDSGGIAQLERDAGGQQPRPSQALVADPGLLACAMVARASRSVVCDGPSGGGEGFGQADRA
jgi:hypothetical protein